MWVSVNFSAPSLCQLPATLRNVCFTHCEAYYNPCEVQEKHMCRERDCHRSFTQQNGNLRGGTAETLLKSLLTRVDLLTVLRGLDSCLCTANNSWAHLYFISNSRVLAALFTVTYKDAQVGFWSLSRMQLSRIIASVRSEFRPLQAATSTFLNMVVF